MRLMCEVMVPSSTTSFASRMSCSRFLTCPGCLASACTIQNSVSVSGTALPRQRTLKRLTSSSRGPRSSRSSAAVGSRGKLGATEERRDARKQVRQAHVLGQVVVGAQPQARDHVEVAVARGEKDDRQRRRERAQVAAQGEAAVDVGAQADVDQGEIGQARAQGAERLAAPRVRRHLEAVLAQRLGVVGADGRVVFDDGDAAGHRGRL